MESLFNVIAGDTVVIKGIPFYDTSGQKIDLRSKYIAARIADREMCGLILEISTISHPQCFAVDEDCFFKLDFFPPQEMVNQVGEFLIEFEVSHVTFIDRIELDPSSIDIEFGETYNLNTINVSVFYDNDDEYVAEGLSVVWTLQEGSSGQLVNNIYTAGDEEGDSLLTCTLVDEDINYTATLTFNVIDPSPVVYEYVNLDSENRVFYSSTGDFPDVGMVDRLYVWCDAGTSPIYKKWDGSEYVTVLYADIYTGHYSNFIAAGSGYEIYIDNSGERNAHYFREDVTYTPLSYGSFDGFSYVDLLDSGRVYVSQESEFHTIGVVGVLYFDPDNAAGPSYFVWDVSTEDYRRIEDCAIYYGGVDDYPAFGATYELFVDDITSKVYFWEDSSTPWVSSDYEYKELNSSGRVIFKSTGLWETPGIEGKLYVLISETEGNVYYRWQTDSFVEIENEVIFSGERSEFPDNGFTKELFIDNTSPTSMIYYFWERSDETFSQPLYENYEYVNLDLGGRILYREYGLFPATGHVGMLYVDTSVDPWDYYLWNGTGYSKVVDLEYSDNNYGAIFLGDFSAFPIVGDSYEIFIDPSATPSQYHYFWVDTSIPYEIPDYDEDPEEVYDYVSLEDNSRIEFYPDFVSFPVTGEVGKFYSHMNASPPPSYYYWDGSSYISTTITFYSGGTSEFPAEGVSFHVYIDGSGAPMMRHYVWEVIS